MIIRIRPSQEVLATSSGTRRRTFTAGGHTHTLDFGKKPIYLNLDAIPAEIAHDPHLHARQVTKAEMTHAGGVLTSLKSERVQDPIVEIPPGTGGTGEEPDLKSERVQEEAPAPLSAAKRKR